jgi:hypothetical protein
MHLRILFIGVLLCCAVPSWAVDPRPAAADPPPAEKPAPPENSSVDAILGTLPTTPAECLRAAKILADNERPDLAKQFLKKVLDAKLDRLGLARLAKEVGSATFVPLAQRKDLQPEGKQVADAALDALNAALQDPQRITALMAQLQDPDLNKRTAAATDLIQAHGAAIRAILAALADPARAKEHPRLRAVFPLMDQEAFWPLIGVLGNADPALKVQVILALESLNVPAATLYLLEPALSKKSDPAVRAAAQEALKRLAGAVPNRSEALRLLSEAAENYLDHKEQIPGEVAGKVEVWRWDPEKRQAVVEEAPAEDAARALAVRLAGDAYKIVKAEPLMMSVMMKNGTDFWRITPEDEQTQQFYLMVLLEAAAYRNGRDKPLEENNAAVSAVARELGINGVNSVLTMALKKGHPAAAAAAIPLLAQFPNAKDFLYFKNGPAAIVRAAQSADRRVRMAAVKGIAAMKPDRPFAGSSAVPNALAFFIASRGSRRALIAGPIAQDNQRLVGGVAAAGYQAELAGNGRDAMRLLVGSPDYELALIDAGIDLPPIEQLLQQIRQDNRSADVRVGVLARSGFSDRADRAAAADPLAKALAQPNDAEADRWQIEQLALLKPRDFVSFEERQRQAAEALDLMAELIRTAGKLYDFRPALPAVLTALDSAALATKAIGVLANFNLPEAQRTLVETASRNTAPLAVRQAAVEAMRENIRAHGILLTTQEIRRQYDRQNQSAQADPETQKILGEILDCLESPKKK